MSPQRILRPLRHALWEDWRLPIVLLTLFSIFFAVLVTRAHILDTRDKRLCQVVASIIISGDRQVDQGAARRLLTPAERAASHHQTIVYLKRIGTICDTEGLQFSVPTSR